MTYYYKCKDIKTLSKLKGVNEMGVIVCQTCGKVIEHFEAEKVSTLYGTCCDSCKNKQAKK